MHWAQFIATCVSFAVVAGGCAGIYFPARGRRDARLALKAAADATALHATIHAAIVAPMEQIKADTLARIDTSDEHLKASLGEVKASVEDVRARVERQELSMAVQFGGNGGGIRQAINELATGQALLAGRFEQHLAEVKG